MVKIIKRQYIGREKVYDIGLEQDHNFLLGNGVIASNCFNKSHSTAYAYVTYQTAYLKANYPVEYMTALLTASSGNKEKIAKYHENCQKMGIEIKPPDINLSQVDFLPCQNSILYGLSAIQNLGEGAIESILKARDEVGGNFESLAHLCAHTDLRVVNRRALETLIFCGALDSLNSNRHQMIKDLDLIISWAHNKAKEKESGQTNLFDFLSNQNPQDLAENNGQKINFDDVPSAPPVADFSLEEKLKKEKELLGFYVSEHPLQSIQKAASLLSPINLSQLAEQKIRTKICTVVIINAVKKIVNKNGEPMAFITIEDMSGESEGVIFSNVYANLEPLLQVDNRLILWGKVDKRNEKYQILVENLEIVENLEMIMIELSYQEAIDRSIIEDLKKILQSQWDYQKAKTPVIAIIREGSYCQFIRFGREFWVTNSVKAVEALQKSGFRVHSTPLLRDDRR